MDEKIIDSKCKLCIFKKVILTLVARQSSDFRLCLFNYKNRIIYL